RPDGQPVPPSRVQVFSDSVETRARDGHATASRTDNRGPGNLWDGDQLFYGAARIRIFASGPRVEVGIFFLVLILILLFRVEVNDAFFYLITVFLRFQRLLGALVAGHLRAIGRDRTARALAPCAIV